MSKFNDARARGESAFTLIELLVVMIIIAILMAVAVPTFLKQKQTAVATKAKANIKQIITTIESCASSNVSGSYVSPRTCTTEATLMIDEPVLTNVFTATAAGEVCDIPAGAAMSYTVTCTFAGETGPVTYSEIHTSTGAIQKTCSPVGTKGCAGPASTSMW